jgi:hypothetical protein
VYLQTLEFFFSHATLMGSASHIGFTSTDPHVVHIVACILWKMAAWGILWAVAPLYLTSGFSHPASLEETSLHCLSHCLPGPPTHRGCKQGSEDPWQPEQGSFIIISTDHVEHCTATVNRKLILYEAR